MGSGKKKKGVIVIGISWWVRGATIGGGNGNRSVTQDRRSSISVQRTHSSAVLSAAKDREGALGGAIASPSSAQH
ncbi:hypothetical protein AHAS_Ahas17G0283000 [Arachis hypogaea]